MLVDKGRSHMGRVLRKTETTGITCACTNVADGAIGNFAMNCFFPLQSQPFSALRLFALFATVLFLLLWRGGGGFLSSHFSGANANTALNQALIAEGLALHYLTDLFSAGHARWVL